MEPDVLEILLSHLQHIAGICKEDIAPLAVFRHILVFTLLEILKFLFVVALNPARLDRKSVV